MGNWFENMEPMNIQEERARTKRRSSRKNIGNLEKATKNKTEDA